MSSNPTPLAEPESVDAIVLVQNHEPMSACRDVLTTTHHLSGLLRAIAAFTLIAALIALAGCATEDELSVYAADADITRCALPE